MVSPDLVPPPAMPYVPPAMPAARVPAGPPAFGADSNEDMGGARAIEVAAMLGDSVVAVRHVNNPRGGKVSSTTYALFAAGALLLCVSGFAFSTSVSNAQYNKHSYEAWTADGSRPEYDWRPRRIGLFYDWLAFGGLIGGLFCVTSGLLRVRNERVSPFFRIGSDPEVEFPTENSPSSSFPLVAPLGDDFVLNFTSDMDGEMMLDGANTPLSELASRYVRSQADLNDAVDPDGFEDHTQAAARYSGGGHSIVEPDHISPHRTRNELLAPGTGETTDRASERAGKIRVVVGDDGNAHVLAGFESDPRGAIGISNLDQVRFLRLDRRENFLSRDEEPVTAGTDEPRRLDLIDRGIFRAGDEVAVRRNDEHVVPVGPGCDEALLIEQVAFYAAAERGIKLRDVADFHRCNLVVVSPESTGWRAQIAEKLPFANLRRLSGAILRGQPRILGQFDLGFGLHA
jgi:hypothetical protein